MDDADFQELKERARRDDAEAHYEIGLMYLRGENVPRSEKAAYAWFGNAAALGHAESQYVVGNRFLGLESYSEALEWLERAAVQGNVRAQNQLGDMYADGWNVEKCDQKAAEWYGMAAEQGNSDGINGLAHIAQRNSSYALDKLAMLAERGDSDAQTHLGFMFYWGFGVERSNERSAEWYMRAAAQGNAEAQYQLGEMYLWGTGVEVSEEKAIE